MAVGIGYLLGRRRNFKTAAVMAAGLAVGSTTAGGLLMKRAGKLAGSTDVLGKVSPQLGDIAGIVQKDLLTAGKAAATAVVSSRVDSLADSIHERAERVRNPASAVTGDDEDEDEDEPANAEADADYEDRDRDQDQDQDQDEEPAASVRRTGATRRSPVTRTSGAAGSATKSASKKAGGGTSTAARSAGGAAKSAASGARSRSGRAKG
jgi:hypothetical protein